MYGGTTFYLELFPSGEFQDGWLALSLRSEVKDLKD